MHTLFKQIIRPLVALFLCVLLFSCGSSSEGNSSKVEIVPLTLVTAQSLTFAHQEYRLVSLNNSSSSAIQFYWPSDSVMPSDFANSLAVLLPQLTKLFSQQHFAFTNPYAVKQNGRYKNVLFMPVTDNTSALSFTLSADNLALVTLDINKLPEVKTLFQPLMALIYRSERAKYQADNTLIGKLVALGLSLHFAEENLPVDQFRSPVVITQEALFDAFENSEKHLIKTVELEADSHWQNIEVDFNSPRVGYKSYRVLVEFELLNDSTGQIDIDDFALIEWQSAFSSTPQPQFFSIKSQQPAYIGLNKSTDKVITLKYQ